MERELRDEDRKDKEEQEGLRQRRGNGEMEGDKKKKNES